MNTTFIEEQQSTNSSIAYNNNNAVYAAYMRDVNYDE
jgi:hypothetical protein